MAPRNDRKRRSACSGVRPKVWECRSELGSLYNIFSVDPDFAKFRKISEVPHWPSVQADWSMQWRRWLGMQARNGKGSWTLSSKMLTRAQHRSFTSARLSTARGSNIHRVHQPWASPWRTHETRCDNQAATLPHEWICSLRYHRICQRRLERGKREAIRPAQPRQKVPNLPAAHALTWSAHSS